MSRVLLLVLAFGLVLSSDLLVVVHYEAVVRTVSENNLDRSVFAYENPTLMHTLHHFEEWLFAGLLIVGLLSFWRRFSSCGLGQCLWGMGLFLLFLSLVLGMFVDMVTEGVEAQAGLSSLSFVESTRVSFLLEALAVAVVAILAWLGPPRGWSADCQLA